MQLKLITNFLTNVRFKVENGNQLISDLSASKMVQELFFYLFKNFLNVK